MGDRLRVRVCVWGGGRGGGMFASTPSVHGNLAYCVITCACVEVYSCLFVCFISFVLAEWFGVVVVVLLLYSVWCCAGE